MVDCDEFIESILGEKLRWHCSENLALAAFLKGIFRRGLECAYADFKEGGRVCVTMASYDEKDYEPILLQSIRADVVVPFDCYLLLRENDRIVHYIQSGQVFPSEKLEKLKNFKHNTLYIHVAGKPAYVAYLESFFNTGDGLAVLKELNANNPGGKILGIPTEIDVAKIVASEVAKDVAGQPVNETVKVVPAGESVPLGEVAVVEQVTDHQKDEVQKLAGKKQSVLEQVVAALKEDIDQLDQEVHASGALSEEQSTLIKSVTDRIDEELQKVEGQPDEPETKTKVESVTEHIKEELARVRSLAEKSEKTLGRTLISAADDAEEELAKMLENPAKHKAALQRKMMRLKHLVNPAIEQDADEFAAEGVSRMVRKVEKLIGVKLAIQPTSESGSVVSVKENSAAPSGKSDETKKAEGSATPAAGAAKQDAGTVPKTAFSNESEMVALIVQQAETIKNLEAKNNFAGKALADVLDKWNDFNAGSRKVFGPDQVNAANRFQLHLDTLKNAYNDTNQQTGVLLRLSETLSGEMKGIKTDGLKKASSEPVATNSQVQSQATAVSSDDADKNKKAQLDVPEQKTESSNIDEVRMENELLRAQLLNAKSLLEKSEEKILELSKMHEENDKYISALEKEGVEHKELVKKAQDQVATIEKENIRHGEHSTELEKQLQIKKAEEEAKDLTLNELRLKMLSLETNIRVFTDAFKAEGLDPAVMQEKDPKKLPFKPEAVAMVVEKDKMVVRLSEQLTQKADEVKEARREIAKLRGLIQGTNLLKKEMSSKVDRINAERETIVKSQEGMQRKIMVLQNLAESERKTVSKLNSIIEELRKDRVEHMGKTAAALKDYKEVMSKAMSLNNHVQAEVQRNKALNEQHQSLVQKQKELASENVQLQKQLKNLEVEYKRVQKLYKDASGSDSTADKSMFDKRIADLREENKKIQTMYATEQRKSQQLEKELKALQFKLKNPKPSAA